MPVTVSQEELFSGGRIFLWSTILIITDTSVLELFTAVVFQWGPCWPIDWQSKLLLKLLDCGRKIQNDVHIDRYCTPELISWWQISITIFTIRFLLLTYQKYVDSSTYWQFFCCRLPVNHLKQQTRNTGHGKALFPGKRVQQQEIYHIACLKQNVG